MPTDEDNKLYFDGSNWEDLNRIIALARFQFLQDEDFDDNDPRRCAYLCQRMSGPALDWVATNHANQPSIFENFEGLIVSLKQAFGVEANNIQALQRKALDDLRWNPQAPVFFAEFDRLTFQLGITDHGTKIAMALNKLPISLKQKLAEQALDFANYETMRERLNTMWALDPSRHGESNQPKAKKPRCGSCGKKGHTAPECRGSKK